MLVLYLPEIPAAPPHRHGQPSGPYPWLDIDQDPDPTIRKTPYDKYDWTNYPESRFPNWKPRQVKNSRMKERISDRPCVIRYVNVDHNVNFTIERQTQFPSDGHTPEQADEFWKMIRDKKHNEVSP